MDPQEAIDSTGLVMRQLIAIFRDLRGEAAAIALLESLMEEVKKGPIDWESSPMFDGDSFALPSLRQRN